ncbi:MAG: TrkA family potassium uptake protein [Desulfovibrionaceae bacterium]
MSKVLEVGIIGLGKFGFSLATTLLELGHKVLGVDRSQARVRMAGETISLAYEGDATDKAMLEQLRLQDMDHVVVSSGQSMEASILISLNLLELGVKELWVKANSVEHETVLTRLGVRHVLFPEQLMARQLGHSLALPGLLDFLPFGGGALLQEFTVDAWHGRTLRDLNLTSKYEVQIVAIKAVDAADYRFVPPADQPLSRGDRLVAVGKAENIAKLVA